MHVLELLTDEESVYGKICIVIDCARLRSRG